MVWQSNIAHYPKPPNVFLKDAFDSKTQMIQIPVVTSSGFATLGAKMYREACRFGHWPEGKIRSFAFKYLSSGSFQPENCIEKQPTTKNHQPNTNLSLRVTYR